MKIPIVGLKALSMCANCGKRGHLSPKAEVADVSNHAVLAADDSHNFLSLPVGNALIDTGAGQDLIGRSALNSLQRKLSESD